MCSPIAFRKLTQTRRSPGERWHCHIWDSPITVLCLCCTRAGQLWWWYASGLYSLKCPQNNFSDYWVYRCHQLVFAKWIASLLLLQGDQRYWLPHRELAMQELINPLYHHAFFGPGCLTFNINVTKSLFLNVVVTVEWWRLSLAIWHDQVFGTHVVCRVW